MWAVNEGKIDLVREILKTDASCVHAVDQDGYTPLHRACYNNNVEMAKLLLKYGANTNAVTEYRWTPLHSACKWGNTECVALLLQFGSNINATSDGGRNFNSSHFKSVYTKILFILISRSNTTTYHCHSVELSSNSSDPIV